MHPENSQQLQENLSLCLTQAQYMCKGSRMPETVEYARMHAQ